MAQDIRYPEIEVQLTGEDGNGFFIIARVLKALRRAGISAQERDAFMSEAQAGDYDHLLQTAMEWVEVV